MRVLFVSQRLPPDHVSGAPLQAIRLARALAREDVDVTILTARFLPRQPRGALMVDGVRVHRLGTVPDLHASYAAMAAAWVRRRDVDLIHGHALSATSLGATFGASVPVVLKPSLGGPSGDLAKIQKSPLAPFLVRVLERADRFAVVGRAIGEELAAAGIPPQKLFATKNGVDLEMFRPDGPAADLGVRGPVVLFVGQLVRRKGIEILMQAWLQIARARTDATLVLVGAGQAPRGERAMALGVRSDVEAIMRAASVLVLPSTSEGVPNVVLEALATGMRVVVGRDLVPPDLRPSVVETDLAPGAIAGAVLSLLEGGRVDPPQAIRAYGMDRVAREYASLYRSILS